MRQGGGLSGFTKRSENEYDPFGAAHSSTSISVGLGMAVARDLKQDQPKVSNGTASSAQGRISVARPGKIEHRQGEEPGAPYGQWVFVVEGAIMKTWLDTDVQTSPFFPVSDTWQSKLDWMATVTGRVGYAWNNVLGYVKGGWAYTSFNDYVQDTADFVNADGKKSGWTLGGGVEFALTPDWIFGIEYNYYDFGSININEASIRFASGSFDPGTDHNLDLTVQTVVGRLTYKFGGYGKAPVMAKY